MENTHMQHTLIAHMENKPGVLNRVSGLFRRRNYNIEALSVGHSEGEFDDGYGETDDLFAVAEWVRRTRPDDQLWLGGFSFGAYIATRAALNLDVGQLIAIAPPVDRYAFDSLHHPECPWLVVQGDEDELVGIDAVARWVDELSPPPDFVVMKQADHMFHRRIMDLRGLLKNGVRDQLPDSDPSRSLG